MTLPLLVVSVPLVPVPLLVVCGVPVVVGPEVELLDVALLAAVVPLVVPDVSALPVEPVAPVLLEVVARPVPVVRPGNTPPSAKVQ